MRIRFYRLDSVGSYNVPSTSTPVSMWVNMRLMVKRDCNNISTRVVTNQQCVLTEWIALQNMHTFITTMLTLLMLVFKATDEVLWQECLPQHDDKYQHSVLVCFGLSKCSKSMYVLYNHLLCLTTTTMQCMYYITSSASCVCISHCDLYLSIWSIY